MQGKVYMDTWGTCKRTNSNLLDGFPIATPQQTVLAPLPAKGSRDKRQVGNPEQASEEMRLACVEERRACHRLPCLRGGGHVVRLQGRGRCAGKTGVDEEVAMFDFNLGEGGK